MNGQRFLLAFTEGAIVVVVIAITQWVPLLYVRFCGWTVSPPESQVRIGDLFGGMSHALDVVGFAGSIVHLQPIVANYFPGPLLLLVE
jgi:hypothetical protein